MDNQLHRSPHSVDNINYHLVWMPRYRKKVLGGPIADRRKILLAEIAAQCGPEILAVEVMPEHVHLFVSAPPKFSPAGIVRYFKGITSRRLKQEFAYLRRQYWGEHATLWAEGYSVGTAGQVSAQTIKHYIEHSQKT